MLCLSMTNGISAVTITQHKSNSSTVVASFPEYQVGDNVTFSVSASGPGLKYQWYQNGVAINGRTSNSLSFSNVQEADSATFHVRVTDNTNDTEWSEPFVLGVRPVSGGDINICNATISPRVNVVHPSSGALSGRDWFAQPFMGTSEKDLKPSGAAVPFYTISALHGAWLKSPNQIRRVSHVPAGTKVLVQFRVWQWGSGTTFDEALANGTDYFASNIFEYTTGGAGTPPSIAQGINGLDEFFFNSGLPITEATILNQPTHLQAAVGAAGSLQVVAEGPGISYQWFCNGLAISNGKAASLNFGSLELDDAGTYHVVVEDENGVSVESDSVVVLPNPSSGGTFNFCNLNLEPGLRQVPVVHPGDNLPLQGAHWLAQPYVGSSAFDMLPTGPAVPFFDSTLPGIISKLPNPTRRVPHVAAGASATFQFRVWQSGKGKTFEDAVDAGSDWFASNIFSHVLGGAGSPPTLPVDPDGLTEFFFKGGLPIQEVTIVASPTSKSVNEGGNTSLQVEAEGPGLTFEWFLNGSPISNSNSDTLNFPSAQLSDAGTYHVVVKDENGKTAVSEPAVLLVLSTTGGTFNFCNLGLDPGNRRVPVIHPNNNAPLSGSDWLAQAFVGANEHELIPVGPAVPFFTQEELKGIFAKAPTATRKATHLDPGTLATFQFRVWESSKGPDFESATNNGSDFFASNIFSHRLGGAGSPPSLPVDPDGLTEFFFNSGLPVPVADITTAPSHVSLNQGANGRMSVEAVGPGLKYQWFFNGVSINGANASSIGFSQATLGQSGTYHVVVTDENDNSATSGPAVLLVIPPNGGSFNFCNLNLDPGNRRVPVIHPNGQEPLSGASWLAQPFVGTSKFDLVPVGPAVPFFDQEGLRGIISKSPSPTRKAAHLDPGTDAIVQFRVWQSGTGVDFDSALENGSDYFASNLFSQTLGGAGSPPSLPTDPDGLTEFFFNSGLPPQEVQLLGQSSHVGTTPGTQVSLNVRAEGPGLSYEWFINGITIPNSNGDTLSFPSISLGDSGTYQAKVTDENGNAVTSEPIIVMVQNAVGGSFNFCNTSLPPTRTRSVPVIHPDTNLPLTGADWIAQPFVGTASFNMEPVGPAVPFFGEEAPGIISKFPNPTRFVPGIDPGSNASFQIRVWQSGTGLDFESALENGSNYFASNVFTGLLGGAGSPPSFPMEFEGLTEFFYNSGLPPKRVEILSQTSHLSLVPGETGQIVVEATGPDLKFDWFFNGISFPISQTGTASVTNEGTYQLRITDGNENVVFSDPIIVLVNPLNGGTFNFCNINIGPKGDGRVPVIHPETDEPLIGTGWIAQPFVGTDRYNVAPVGPPVPFYTSEDLAGIFLKDPSPTRKVPNLDPGTDAIFQIRVWEVGIAPTFEDSVQFGANYFTSNFFSHTLGGAGAPPSVPVDLDGLEEWFYNSGLPSPEAIILEDPDHHYGLEGNSVVLKAMADGPELSYQWFRNGAPISGSNSPELLLESGGPADQGTYWMVATDGNGKTAMTGPAIVAINAQNGGTYSMCNIIGARQVPVIHPDTQEGLAGTGWLAQIFIGPNQYDLSPTGAAMPFYEDEALAGIVVKDSNPARATSLFGPGETVTIQYRVWETGKGASFSEALDNESNFFASNVFDVQLGGFGAPPSLPANLDGLEEFFFNDGLPPEIAQILDQTSHVSTTPGEEVTLSVNAVGPGLKFDWFFNGIPFPISQDGTVKFTNIDISNQGTYWVKVTDSNDNSVISAPMIVLVNPTQGGSFNLCNINLEPGTRSVPVIHPDTQEPLSGIEWLAQPFVGTNRYDVQPVGPPIPFFDGDLAGIILKNPTPTRKVANLDPGTEAVFQIRVWQSGTGESFDSALIAGSNYFASNFFSEVLGGAGAPPTLPVDMDGLQEFFYNSGLPPQEAIILEQPEHVLAPEGSDVSISVLADGPGISYQWFRNGLPIEGADEAEIGSDSAALTQQGTYHVIVTDENGVSVVSEPAIVIITPLTGGGTFEFCNVNIGPSAKQVLVENPDTNQLLTGNAWYAQPFVGSSPFDLQPVGPAVPFYGDNLPGVWRKEKTTTRIIPHIAAGETATIQVRIWESAKGPGFFEAVNNESNFFASNVFELVTGGAGAPPSIPAHMLGLESFSFNDGLPDVNVLWQNPEAITYGTQLDGTQLDAQTVTPGSFVYNPPAGTILDAGIQKLTAVFTPDNPEFDPVEISVQILVNKAVPTFVGAPANNWPVETPLEEYLFSTIVFNTQGTKTGILNGNVPIVYGTTSVSEGSNLLKLDFTPDDQNNWLPVSLDFTIDGLKPKEEEVVPEETVVTKEEISIKLPIEPNTFYQIELTEDFITWVVVFVSTDDQSAEFKAALDETATKGFFRIRSFEK